MIMTHPGLPALWAIMIAALACVFVLRAMFSIPQGMYRSSGLVLQSARLRSVLTRPWLLLLFKIVILGFFLLVILAGLLGTPVAGHNIATVLTWNLWWAGLILTVFLFGSAWCGMCPWDTLATWLVRQRTWGRNRAAISLNLKVPARWRNVWPATWMFIGLTWLELGVGVTTSPYMTALLSLIMIVLATLSLAVFEGKAFCHYVCPVGRTIGVYAQLSPLKLRSLDSDVCTSCKTLECFHGNEKIEACPTHLMMGSLQQSTYCTSCGNCTQSCPHDNISWRLQTVSHEAIQDARPHWDEAWFMLVLLALTSFHGLTMLPGWEASIRQLAQYIGDSGQLLMSFSAGLFVSMLLPIALYALCIGLWRQLYCSTHSFRQLFSGMAFVAIPLAFSYHLAHNLNHLVRENSDLAALLSDPFGKAVMSATTHTRSMTMWLSQDSLFLIQAGLMVFGMWIAVKVIRHRGVALVPAMQAAAWKLWPLLLFALLVVMCNTWLLAQPMTMRM